jgi:hypothetical protein
MMEDHIIHVEQGKLSGLAAARHPHQPSIVAQMAGEAERGELHHRRGVVLGDVGACEFVLPAQVKFPWAAALAVTGSAAILVGFLNSLCDYCPISRVKIHAFDVCKIYLLLYLFMGRFPAPYLRVMIGVYITGRSSTPVVSPTSTLQFGS